MAALIKIVAKLSMRQALRSRVFSGPVAYDKATPGVTDLRSNFQHQAPMLTARDSRVSPIKASGMLVPLNFV